MSTYLLVIAAILLILSLLVWFIRRLGTPEATARELLLQYAKWERTGIPEPDRIFLLLAKRPGWQKLPKEFLREISTRLGTKEDVIRFVVLVETYDLEARLQRFAMGDAPRDAAFSVAMLLASLGNNLQGQGELGKAELAQSLALRVEPDKPATMLPLALTYYVTGRYKEAIPLFERGLPLLSRESEQSQKILDAVQSVYPLPREELFGSRSDVVRLEQLYREAYQDSLRRVGDSKGD